MNMNKINEKALRLDKAGLGYLISIAVTDLVESKEYNIMNAVFKDPTELPEVVSLINNLNAEEMTVQEQEEKVSSTLRDMIDYFKSL